MSDHASTVRWHEQMFLWSCHLYYVEDKPVFDDAAFDAVVRCLDLNRDLWSPVFRERMALIDAGPTLMPTAHLVRLTDDEIADAHTWAGYITFLRRF